MIKRVEKMMGVLRNVGLLLLCSVVFTHAQTCSQTVVSGTVDCTNYAVGRGKLALDGIQMVDEFGNIVQLRGVSSHGLQYNPECITKDAIEYLVTNWGINVYRAAVYVDDWRNGYSVNAEYFDPFIQNIVQWCKELGIYVIIDWHVIGDPNAYLNEYYHGTHGLAVDFFGNYSLMYKDETHVIYEIANKPYNVNWDNLVWYHNLIIDTIRAHDADAIIIAGTPGYSTEIDKAFAEPVTSPHNVFYAFHFYAAQDADLIPLLEEHIDKMPLFVSHWTISDDTDDGPYNISVAEIYLELLSGENDATPPPTVVSWVQWSFSDFDETASLLEPDACSTEQWSLTSCPGKFTENYLKDRAYAYVGSELECDTVPTPAPTISPAPTGQPSSAPTTLPPTSVPSTLPPTHTPTTAEPSQVPTTSVPTSGPSISLVPTSIIPTSEPSYVPSNIPTSEPSFTPSGQPSSEPSDASQINTSSDANQGTNIPPAGWFFIAAAGVGTILTGYYFYDARKRNNANQALYSQTTMQKPVPSATPHTTANESGNDMEMGSIYSGGDDFSASQQSSAQSNNSQASRPLRQQVRRTSSRSPSPPRSKSPVRVASRAHNRM